MKDLKRQKKIYLGLMIFPLPTLIISGVIGIFFAFMFREQKGILLGIWDLFAMLIGLVSVISLLLLPIWIIRYINVSKKLSD